MKLLFVINPNAGTTGNNNLMATFEKALPPDVQHKAYLTKGQGDVEQIKKLIKVYAPDTLVAVGGDGTINLSASLVLGTSMSLGIIPAGSANGLAVNLNIPKNALEALRLILNQKAKPIDILTINQKHLCLHLSDAGINARIVKRFEEEGSKGMLGYGKQLIKELMTKTSTIRLTIKTAEKTKQTKAEVIVVANAAKFGTGVAVNPTGVINDGVFELIIIKPYPWWFIFYFTLVAIAGKLHKIKHVKIMQTSEATIQFQTPQDVQIDGEIIENQEELHVKIEKKALSVIY